MADQQNPQAPGQMPGQMMPNQMMPGQMMPGQMMPGQMMPNQMMGANPMMMMMQMMQMMGGGIAPTVDPAALPFSMGQVPADEDLGLDADIIRPSKLSNRIKTQEAVPVGSVLDLLCLTDDGESALGGVPKGCTIALAGPPGKGKTRSALAAVALVAQRGHKVALVVAEEGFHNGDGGRDDLCSRLVKIGMTVTNLDEQAFETQVLENLYVMESQYHKGQSWDDFVTKYRYLIERESIDFVVIDSLNMLDPTKHRTADNLSALKTYNHEKGITCLCIGQIRDTGQPVGGEALQHTADAVFLIEEMGLGSKDIAALWGGKYRERIDVIRVVKSVTTRIFNHPIRLARTETGVLTVHEAQPEDFAVLAPKDA